MTNFNDVTALNSQVANILKPTEDLAASGGLSKDGAASIATNFLSKQNVRDLQQQMVMTMLEKNVAFTPEAIGLLSASRVALNAGNFVEEPTIKMQTKADVLKDIGAQLGLTGTTTNSLANESSATAALKEMMLQGGASKQEKFDAVAAALPTMVSPSQVKAIKEQIAASMPSASLSGGSSKPGASLAKFTSDIKQLIADAAPRPSTGDTMVKQFMVNFTSALSDGQVSGEESANLSAQMLAMVGKYDLAGSGANKLGSSVKSVATGGGAANGGQGTASSAPTPAPYDWTASGASNVRSDGSNVFVDKRLWDTNSTFSPKNTVFTEIPHLFRKTASGALDIQFAKAADGTDWVVLPSGANTDFVLSAINSSAKSVVAQVNQTKMTVASASTATSNAPSEPDWVANLAGSESRGVNANFLASGATATADQVRQGYLDRSGGFA